MLWFEGSVKGDPWTPKVAVLVGNAQKSVVSRARRVCVLIASADSERIMLVRESLHAWPETVVCRVAVNREEALQHIESNAPHLLCWDTALGTELPAEARGIWTLLLREDCCTLVGEPPWATTISADYVDGLQHSINREYGLRRLLMQLQPAPRPSAPPSTPPGVSEDRLRAVGRLAAGLAHEVNNPLTFVLANLESLRESHQAIRRFVRRLRMDFANQEAITAQSFEQIVGDSNLQEVIDDAADMLTDCYKGMHRIQDIARSLGTFSRGDHDHAEMVDVTQVVDDACAMVFSQIRYRARLVKRFEPIPMVAAYPGRIAQALVNLLTNAAEAIEGGAYNKHRIVVSTRATDEHVVIAVRDSGEGIREDHRDRIFTAGFTTKASRGGMGIGLASCQRVANDHNGRLEVHHLAEGGTTFELIIPIDTGLAVSATRRESHPISDAPMKRARLLIVDDDAMVLSALRRRLHRRYDVVTVLGGEEALALLAADPDFDSIVCDLMMPKVDGKSFYEVVQSEHPELTDRIVFMSGGAFTPRLRKFAASVSNPMLQKPVSREELERMLSTHHRDSSE